ncbi:MAG: HdeD family acid-resistance protein [Paracoccaceae bacterium]
MADTTYSDDLARSVERPTGAIKRNWGWMLAIGVLLVLGGILAFLLPFVASIAVEAMVGAVLFVSGIAQGVHAFRAHGWRARGFSIASSVIYVVGAVLILLNPLAGLVALTLLTISVIGADGVVRVIMGARMRPEDGWGWMVASGVVSIVLAVVLFLAFPAISLTLLGILLAISLVMEGTAFVASALVMRRRAS